MSLNVVQLTAKVYDERLKAFIKSVEGERFDPYVDSVGVPTIGWGFALNKDSEGQWRNYPALSYFLHTILGVNNPELSKGPELSSLSIGAKGREAHWERELEGSLVDNWVGCFDEDLQTELNNILAQRAEDIKSKAYTDNDRKLIGTAALDFKYYKPEQIAATFDKIKPDYERRLNIFGAALPQNCDERIALFSMAYQGNPLGASRADLIAALKLPNSEDARAKAWYAIRYLRKSEPWRGYMESAKFDLYYDNENVKIDDARAAYMMYTRNHEYIYNYDFENAGKINKAHEMMAEAGLSIDHEVLEIGATLSKARKPLIEDLRNQYKNQTKLMEKLANEGRFMPVDIYLAKGSGPDSLTHIHAAQGRTRDSLLIGSELSDRLIGEKGNDVLIGGGGIDHLHGGMGDDLLCGGLENDSYWIVSGEGTDTIEDKEGRYNEVIIDRCVVGQFVTNRRPDGTVWKSVDGKFEGKYDKTDFVVTKIATGTKVILNEDFKEGDFGIEFCDELKPPEDPETDNVIEGDLDPGDPGTAYLIVRKTKLGMVSPKLISPRN